MDAYEKENTIVHNLWEAEQAALKEKYITKQAYLKKQKVQINNLAPHLKELEEENKA